MSVLWPGLSFDAGGLASNNWLAFFLRAAHHLNDPHWSSEGFLKAAKGPLAPLYKSVLPAVDHGLADLLRLGDLTKEKLKTWGDQVKTAWKQTGDQFIKLQKISEENQAKVDEIVRQHQAELTGWLEENEEPLLENSHVWQRLAKSQGSPSADEVPFEKQRIQDAQNKAITELNAWISQVSANESDMRKDLSQLLDPGSRTETASHQASLERINLVMKYGITAIGACLIMGLFARLAAVLGAGFLLTVVLSQPPWLEISIPTYPQILEMLALLTLATFPVGRWLGLDFFLYSIVARRCCSAKGKTDAP